MNRLAIAAFAVAVLASCATSPRPIAPGPDRTEVSDEGAREQDQERLAVTAASEQLQRAKWQLSSHRGAGDCPEVCRLSELICQASERICAISDRHGEESEFLERCQSARRDCQESSVDCRECK